MISKILYSPLWYLSKKIDDSNEINESDTSKQILKRFFLYCIGCLYICFIGAITSFLIWMLFKYPQIIIFILILGGLFVVGVIVLDAIKRGGYDEYRNGN